MTVNIRKCKKERTQQICWKVQGFQSSLWTGRNIKLFQTFREDRLASHFFSDVFPLKEFTTMGLMYLLEVPSLEEILNLGIHQIAAVLEQIPFPLYRICWRPCYVDSDCMRWEVGGGGGGGVRVWKDTQTRVIYENLEVRQEIILQVTFVSSFSSLLAIMNDWVPLQFLFNLFVISQNQLAVKLLLISIEHWAITSREVETL